MSGTLPRGKANEGLIKLRRFVGGIILFFGCIILLNFGSQIINPPPPTPTVDPATIPYKGNIVDLIEAEKIEVVPRGSGIDELDIDVRRLVEDLLDVEISVGTYFLSTSGSVQNMIVRTPQNVLLETDDWLEVKLEVACANMRREVPYSNDSFEIVRAPDQSELQTLMAYMEKAPDELGPYFLSYDVVQAAVWIVTDDANYEGLGTLVSSYVIGGPQTRSIGPYETTRAMELVDRAGIDITQKAIWKDCQKILNMMEEDTEEAKWLREKMEGQ
jgi:hypothetical protein